MYQKDARVQVVPWGTYVCDAKVLGARIADVQRYGFHGARIEQELKYKIQLMKTESGTNGPGITMEVSEDVLESASKIYPEVDESKLSKKQNIYRHYLINATLKGNSEPLSMNMYFEG